jgi:hypothetical protein
LRTRFNQFLEKNRVFELLSQAELVTQEEQTIKFTSNDGKNISLSTYKLAFPPRSKRSIKINGLLIVRKEGGSNELFSGCSEDALDFYFPNSKTKYFSTDFAEMPINKKFRTISSYKFEPHITMSPKISFMYDLDKVYIFLKEFFTRFSLEF